MDPLRVFVSHKISTHGKGAEDFARTLRNITSKDKLDIFVSPEVKPGEPWNRKVHENLKAADILVVLYLVEDVLMGWCDYEAGYFLGVSETAKDFPKKIISVINCEKPPEFLTSHQFVNADEKGIEKLLRSILSDPAKPVKPSLFDADNIDDLKQIKNKILQALNPSSRKSISPRLWIKINDKQLELLRRGVVPKDLHLKGESEALREFGIGVAGGVSYQEFYDRSKYKRVLDLYMPHLVEAIQKIIDHDCDYIPIPPVRISQGPYAKTLVPAYIERNFDKSLKIEFLVYQPRASFNVNEQTAPNILFNLIVVAWRFRWMVIDEFLERLLDRKDRVLANNAFEVENFKRDLKELRMKISLVTLDALNRGIEFVRKIEQAITNAEERCALHQMHNPIDGVWQQLVDKLDEGIIAFDIESVIGALKEMHLLNMRYLKIITKEFFGYVRALDEKQYD